MSNLVSLPRAGLALVLGLVGAATLHADSLWLSALDLANATQGWGQTRADRSITDTPLRIAGQAFEHGVGTHANGVMWIDLGGAAERFRALVGVDDDCNEPKGSVVFRVVGDGKTLFKSAVLKSGMPAAPIDVPLQGVKTLILITRDGGDGIDYDHADWADARIEWGAGGAGAPEARGTGAAEARRAKPPALIAPPREEAVILTPKPAPQPRINSAKVFGVRPGAPFLFTIAATGDRPMTFAADKLPSGLALDLQTGRISGRLTEAQRGTHLVTLRAKNAAGEATQAFRIVCGDLLALTPPMGWNSWYVLENRVTDKDMRAAADALVSSGLINHGYTYVNIDDCWMVKPGADDPALGGPPRDADGRIRPNSRFPDMPALAEYVHSKGLKAGLYISPGPKTCAGFEGSWQHEELDARTFAEWGFDFLKYDWCTYGDADPKPADPKTADPKPADPKPADLNQSPERERGVDGVPAKEAERARLQRPYRKMGALLKQQPRDIVFNLCQYGMGDVWEWGAEVGGHCWRTEGDLGGSFAAIPGELYRIGFKQNGLEKWAGPGHWNDPDYLLLGFLSNWKGGTAPTPLSPNEQYTHVSLWCLLAAPLVFSGDITRLDDFTLSLLTNDEVLEIDQDPLGRQGRRVAQPGDELEVWAKPLEDGSLAVGFFNKDEFETTIPAKWNELGISGKQRVRDLWRQKDLGVFDTQYEARVPRHGAVLVRMASVKE